MIDGLSLVKNADTMVEKSALTLAIGAGNAGAGFHAIIVKEH